MTYDNMLFRPVFITSARQKVFFWHERLGLGQANR